MLALPNSDDKNHRIMLKTQITDLSGSSKPINKEWWPQDSKEIYKNIFFGKL